MIAIVVATKALAEVADGLDKWIKHFRANPTTTPIMAQSLVNPPKGMSSDKNTAMLALMLATAIQRMAVDECD